MALRLQLTMRWSYPYGFVAIIHELQAMLPHKFGKSARFLKKRIRLAGRESTSLRNHTIVYF